MKIIVLDGTTWKTKDDFYDAFFRAVGAPSWHGRNFNALRDSIAGKQVNQVEIPYTVRISGLHDTPTNVKALVKDFCGLLKELRAEGHEVDVDCRE